MNSDKDESNSTSKRPSSLLNPVRLVKSLRLGGENKDTGNSFSEPPQAAAGFSTTHNTKRREVQSMRLPKGSDDFSTNNQQRPQSTRIASQTAHSNGTMSSYRHSMSGAMKVSSPIDDSEELDSQEQSSKSGSKLRGLIAKVGSKVSQTLTGTTSNINSSNSSSSNHGNISSGSSQTMAAMIQKSRPRSGSAAASYSTEPITTTSKNSKRGASPSTLSRSSSVSSPVSPPAKSNAETGSYTPPSKIFQSVSNSSNGNNRSLSTRRLSKGASSTIDQDTIDMSNIDNSSTYNKGPQPWRSTSSRASSRDRVSQCSASPSATIETADNTFLPPPNITVRSSSSRSSRKYPSSTRTRSLESTDNDVDNGINSDGINNDISSKSSKLMTNMLPLDPAEYSTAAATRPRSSSRARSNSNSHNNTVSNKDRSGSLASNNANNDGNNNRNSRPMSTSRRQSHRLSVGPNNTYEPLAIANNISDTNHNFANNVSNRNSYSNRKSGRVDLSNNSLTHIGSAEPSPAAVQALPLAQIAAVEEGIAPNLFSLFQNLLGETFSAFHLDPVEAAEQDPINTSFDQIDTRMYSDSHSSHPNNSNNTNSSSDKILKFQRLSVDSSAQAIAETIAVFSLLTELLQACAQLTGQLCFHLGDAAETQIRMLLRLCGLLKPTKTTTTDTNSAGNNSNINNNNGLLSLLRTMWQSMIAVYAHFEPLIAIARILLACVVAVSHYLFDLFVFRHLLPSPIPVNRPSVTAATASKEDNGINADKSNYSSDNNANNDFSDVTKEELEDYHKGRLEVACSVLAFCLGIVLCFLGGEIATVMVALSALRSAALATSYHAHRQAKQLARDRQVQLQAQAATAAALRHQEQLQLEQLEQERQRKQQEQQQQWEQQLLMDQQVQQRRARYRRRTLLRQSLGMMPSGNTSNIFQKNSNSSTSSRISAATAGSSSVYNTPVKSNNNGSSENRNNANINFNNNTIDGNIQEIQQNSASINNTNAMLNDLQVLHEPTDDDLRREQEEALQHGDMWVALQTLRDDLKDVHLVLAATHQRPDVLKHVHDLLAFSAFSSSSSSSAASSAFSTSFSPSKNGFDGTSDPNIDSINQNNNSSDNDSTENVKLTVLDVAVLVLQTVDPQRLSRAVLVIGSRLAAVLFTLRFSFAQTVALAQSLSSVLAKIGHQLLDYCLFQPHSARTSDSAGIHNSNSSGNVAFAEDKEDIFNENAHTNTSTSNATNSTNSTNNSANTSTKSRLALRGWLRFFVTCFAQGIAIYVAWSLRRLLATLLAATQGYQLVSRNLKFLLLSRLQLLTYSSSFIGSADTGNSINNMSSNSNANANDNNKSSSNDISTKRDKNNASSNSMKWWRFLIRMFVYTVAVSLFLGGLWLQWRYGWRNTSLFTLTTANSTANGSSNVKGIVLPWLLRVVLAPVFCLEQCLVALVAYSSSSISSLSTTTSSVHVASTMPMATAIPM